MGRKRQEYVQWAIERFGATDLGDKRRTRRLVMMAGDIRADPQASLPRQCRTWARTKAACRLLSNERVEPQAIQQAYRKHTARRCSGYKRILCVQDTTALDFSRRAARGSIRGVGPLGKKDGGGQGLLQHAALAVTEKGRPLGVLDQRLHVQHRAVPGETRAQRRARDTEADVWRKCADHVAPLPFDECRVIHIVDRHGDVFAFMQTAVGHGHGFVVRSMHDRYVQSDDPACPDHLEELEAQEAAEDRAAPTRAQPPSPTSPEPAPRGEPASVRLRAKLADQPVQGKRDFWVSPRTGNPKQKRKGRNALLEMRYMAASICPPRNDPRYTDSEPLAVTVVEVKEADPPAEVQPVRWILLTTEPVSSTDDAWEVVDWYTRRWVIEEWHRVLKEGCRIEKSQLDDAKDIERLAMILGPVAVELLALRDAADDPATGGRPGGVEVAEHAGKDRGGRRST